MSKILKTLALYDLALETFLRYGVQHLQHQWFWKRIQPLAVAAGLIELQSSCSIALLPLFPFIPSCEGQQELKSLLLWTCIMEDSSVSANVALALADSHLVSTSWSDEEELYLFL